MDGIKVSRLKLERLKRGWTIAYVAERVNVSISALSNWEAGRQMPAADKAIRLADLYGVDVKEIFSA